MQVSRYTKLFNVMCCRLISIIHIFLQYYVKNGTCKFGSNCKYDHPREGGFVPVVLNRSGYPLRPVGVLSQSTFHIN
jgi:hypothetical protein